MERRRAIKQMAVLSLAGMALPGCGRQQSGVLSVARDAVGDTRDALTPPAYILTPQQTAGPFYFDPRLMRRDITEGRPGIPLRLHLSVVDADRCEPIEDAVVDVWHADAAGLYSGFGEAALDPVTGARPDFMRGVQRTRSRWESGVSHHMAGMVSEQDGARPLHRSTGFRSGGDVTTLLPGGIQRPGAGSGSLFRPRGAEPAQRQ